MTTQAILFGSIGTLVETSPLQSHIDAFQAAGRNRVWSDATAAAEEMRVNKTEQFP